MANNSCFNVAPPEWEGLTRAIFERFSIHGKNTLGHDGDFYIYAPETRKDAEFDCANIDVMFEFNVIDVLVLNMKLFSLLEEEAKEILKDFPKWAILLIDKQIENFDRSSLVSGLRWQPPVQKNTEKS